MIPVPLIVLGISATTLGVRRLRKKVHCNTMKAIDENRKKLETWCKSEGLASTSDGTFDLNAHLSNSNPLIIEALIQDFKNSFEFLIEQKVDVNAMNSKGKTALFYCKNNEQIEKLIKAGADVNARDLLGKTALFYCKSVDLAKVFISAGIDVNARDLHGRTAIFGCCNVLIADVLLENGADLLIQDEEGKTVLHTLSTAKKGLYFSLEFAQIYVTHTPMLMNITDNMGKKAEICKLYLEEKQYEETLDNEDKKKLLTLSPNELFEEAVHNGQYYIARTALRLVANAKGGKKNQVNCNMIYFVVKNNNPYFIPLLLQNGGDVNQTIDNISALDRAVLDYHPECVKELLACGAEITENTIRLAKSHIHPEIYAMICKTDEMPLSGIIPESFYLENCSQSERNHYLLSAVNAYDIKNVQRLLSAGADPNAVANGKGVLAIAVEKNAPEIIQALFDAGADINKEFEAGTALSCACSYCQDGCVELLLELGAQGEDYLLAYNGCARIRKIWKKYKSRSEMEEKV